MPVYLRKLIAICDFLGMCVYVGGSWALRPTFGFSRVVLKCKIRVTLYLSSALLVMFFLFLAASDDVIVSIEPKMWLDALEICRELQPPMSTPSYAFLGDRNKTFITNLHRHLGGMSGWLYGIEGSRKNGTF